MTMLKRVLVFCAASAVVAAVLGSVVVLAPRCEVGAQPGTTIGGVLKIAGC